MSITRSASVNISQIFNSVGAVANGLTVAVDSLSSTAEALQIKSDEWLHNLRITSSARRDSMEAHLVGEVLLDSATRLNAVRQKLEADPALAAIYAELLPSAQAAVNKALGR